jgi:aspartyl-tRNA(Asn)/glutamyl-tRNA(Gln) amidotransferase subunit A
LGNNLLYERLTSLAAKIRSGEVTPRELVDLLLKRIEETEEHVKAYVTVNAEQARKAANTAEKEVREGKYRGLLHGIPISVKDLIDTKGVKTTYGSSIFRDNIPDKDAAVVKRLKEAGAVILGKTNTPEFAIHAITPPTRNPWSLDRIPGGSSGGSAAAIATGSALATLGSDTGGSIRNPASFCGIVGLLPTYGTVSCTGVFPESWSLDNVGPITRYVEDSAVMMQHIAQYNERENAKRRGKHLNYISEIKKPVENLRAGIPVNYFFENINKEVLSAVKQAIKVVERLGVNIREVNFPAVDEIIAAYTSITLAEEAAIHKRMYYQYAQEYTYESKVRLEASFFISATEYIDALRIRPKLIAQVLEKMRDVDVVLMPTQPIVAPKVGETKVMINGHSEDYSLSMIRLLKPFNLLGFPALSICCGFNSQNLPIGLQIIGKPFQDPLVLRIGHHYEQATPWYKQLTKPL